jgi:universal stress protein E
VKEIQKILYVSQGLTDEASSMKQALSIAGNNNAELRILLVCPELPKEMKDYKDRYESSLVDQVKQSIRSAHGALNRGNTAESLDIEVDSSDPFLIRYGTTTIQVEVESGSAPAVRIIRHVLRSTHDLIIKEAEPTEGGKGFRGIDMELLRKCPCPLMLCHPISNPRNQVKVAVAVDPASLTPEGHNLSLRLLETSRSYADNCSGELQIISCWDYGIENALRQNPWMTMKSEQVDEIMSDYRNESRKALDSLIQQANIHGKMQVHHVRGSADKVIPDWIEQNSIDILVMGTLARKGIEGFVIGNTAENIVQKLGCSLLAFKPNGFVSPVKPY